MHRFLLFALVSCCALADTVTVTGSCSQNPCQVQITDQFGDLWAYASTNIEQEPSGVIGSIYTRLNLIGAYEAYNPGATAADPSEQFSVVVDLPKVQGTLDVFLSTVSGCDAYQGCNPVLNVSGLQGGTDIGYGVTEYTDVPPIQVTLSGLVTTTSPDSWNELGFNISWTDPPGGGLTGAPEPGMLSALGLLLMGGVWASRRYGAAQSIPTGVAASD